MNVARLAIELKDVAVELKLKAEGLSVSAHGGSRKPNMSSVAAQEVGNLAR